MAINLGLISLDLVLSTFNPTRMADMYNGPEPYIHHIFMTRPDLNLFSKKLPIQRWADLDAMSYYLLPGDNLKITRSLTDASDSVFLPIMSYAKGYQVDDRTLKTSEKGMTFLGQTIQYANKSIEHKKLKNFSLELPNDLYLTAWKMCGAWREYINVVTFRSDFGPKPKYIYPEPSLDYAVSMYYFVTKADMRTLVYWEKIYGVYPTSVPDSMFSSSNNQKIFEPTVQVQFACSAKSDPNILGILEDFNALSSSKGHQLSLTEDSKGMPGARIARNFRAKTPFITKHPQKHEYYLAWGNEVTVKNDDK